MKLPKGSRGYDMGSMVPVLALIVKACHCSLRPWACGAFLEFENQNSRGHSRYDLCSMGSCMCTES